MSDEQVGRLAMRVEGQYWVGYYAETSTMKDALELGRISMAAVKSNRERKDAFMALMAECVNDLIEDATGTRPYTGLPQTAPEHERSGSA